MSQLLFTLSYAYEKPVHALAAIQADNRDFILAGRVYDKHDKAIIRRVMVNGNIVWEKTYEAEYSAFFESITQLSDGSFAAVGTCLYSEMAGDELVWIARINADGDIIAEKTLGRKEDKNNGYDVIATSDGGFLVTASIISPDTDAAQTWVIKFDKNFNQTWDKTFAGSVAFSVTQTKDGGYALAGSHLLPGSPNSNVYVLRLDANGNALWEKIFDEYEVYVLINSDIIEDSDGNLIIAAKSVLFKLSPSGETLCSFQNENLCLNALTQMPDGSYAIGGSSIVNFSDHTYIAVIDQKCENVLWDNTEMMYPSGTGELFVNTIGYLTGGFTVDDKMVLSSFDFSEKI